MIESGFLTPRGALLMAGELPGWKDVVQLMSERWTGWGAALDELAPGSRRPPRGRLWRLAETAALYVSARTANEPAPNRRVAQLQDRSVTKVRDDLRAARRAELLTEAVGRGRAGGTLTPKARAILGEETT